MALFDQNPGMIGPLTTPNTSSEVDFNNETVQGRIGGMLGTDDGGNYTNPVVRQAVDRQEQAFNARGLRNSSIAVQGGTEAAISKAIDIAAPDAKTYYDNRRANVDTGNQFARDRLGAEVDFAKQKDTQAFEKQQQDSTQNFELNKQNNAQAFELGKQKDTQAFQLRSDYQKAVQNIGTNYQRQLDTINASDMEPADKSVAIQQAAAVRDGEIAFQNNLYSRMPQWQAEWTAPSVPAAGTFDMPSVSNMDTLVNIANDPGQPQYIRDQATAQIAALNQQAVAQPTGTVAPDQGPAQVYDPFGVGGGFNGVFV